MQDLDKKAKERKERLVLLKAQQLTDQQAEDIQENKAAIVELTAESSLPKKRQLQEESTAEFKTLEEKAKEISQQTNDKQIIPEQIDLETLVPKKVDWDLKRKIQNKLDKLDRITEKKIAELIRMKIKSGKGDLAGAVKGVDVNVDARDDD